MRCFESLVRIEAKHLIDQIKPVFAQNFINTLSIFNACKQVVFGEERFEMFFDFPWLTEIVYQRKVVALFRAARHGRFRWAST